MKTTTIIRFTTLALAGLLAACSAPREYFAVPGGEGRMVLAAREPGSSAHMTLDAQSQVVTLDGQHLQRADIDLAALRGRMAQALSAQPQGLQHFTLYFVEGSDVLTPQSQTVLLEILEQIAKRPAPDLVVVGHTDRVGSVAANDALALKRAQSVRDVLLGRGIEAEAMQVSGRGEREPLVPTADEVPEPRNRRVEILVR